MLLATVFAVASAHAEDKFSVHGFGFQDYRQTNANSAGGIDQRGSWSDDILAFVISGKISDRNEVWAQLETTGTQPTAFTWAFMDHRFSDNLSAHIGRVKYPLGLYNEYVDNKWLQLGAVQPSIYLASTDMVHDAYEGVGVDWTTGSLFTQLFTGNNYNNPPDWQSTPLPDFADRRIFGGRITWTTPYEGLRFLASGYRTQVEATAGLVPGQGELGHEDRWILSLDYVTDSFDIKGEYAGHKVPQIAAQIAVTSYASYIQAGYKMEKWTPYVRYDSVQTDESQTSDPSYYQKDTTVGVGYKINDNVNARVEDHLIHGYGLAVAGGDMAAGTGKTDWNLMAAEVNFLF